MANDLNEYAAAHPQINIPCVHLQSMLPMCIVFLPTQHRDSGCPQHGLVPFESVVSKGQIPSSRWIVKVGLDKVRLQQTNSPKIG